MLEGLGSKLVERHGRNEPAFVHILLFHVKIALLSLITMKSVQVVEQLNVSKLCECNSECVHGMVAMIVTLGPIFDFFDFMSISIFIFLGESQLVVFIPIEFLHHIDQLPIFAQSGCNRTNGWHNHTGDLGENTLGFSCNVLRVAQVTI